MSSLRTSSIAAIVSLAAVGAGCSDSPSEGVIVGTVVAGPTCPTEDVATDDTDECADRAVSGAVVVLLDEGAEVARGVSDGEGRFEIEAPSGLFQLTAQPVEGLLAEPTPLEIEVREGQTTTIEPLVYDTGIR